MKNNKNNVFAIRVAHPALRPIAASIKASLLGLGVACAPVNAATITATSSSDDNGVDCTLREAIVSANTSVDQENGCAPSSDLGVDTIYFNNRLSSSLTPNDNQLDVTAGKILILMPALLTTALPSMLIAALVCST